MADAVGAVESFTLQPAGCVALELRKGRSMQVTDVEGKQVGDLIAFALDDLREKLWVSNTIRLNGTIHLGKGHVLYSELSRPMLTITDDTCGVHDILAGSCNAEIDKVRYGVDDHKGCVENFLSALAPWGIAREDIPMSFNLFMNCPVTADGGWRIAEPSSTAGDRIDLRAEMDLLVCLSNCPQDLNPCNAGRLTPLVVTIS